jgi:hypothetical protein
MADSIEQLSFELTMGALTQQERAVTSLRTSAGTVLGAASIAGSFLAGRVGGRSLDVWAVVAMLAFALCVATAIWVLLPRDLAVSVDGGELMAASDDDRLATINEAYRGACGWIEAQLDRNRHTIDRLTDWLSVSYLLLAIEVVLWTISLTATLRP